MKGTADSGILVGYRPPPTNSTSENWLIWNGESGIALASYVTFSSGRPMAVAIRLITV